MSEATIRIDLRADTAAFVRGIDRAVYALLCMELVAAGAMFTEGF